ncbi:hypothetical protein HD554DRAFT_2041180 [Boletus coccyginus]|nr:hypothetical protein HD554DRAFT_2041180 [Boletus coccyginus]
MGNIVSRLPLTHINLFLVVLDPFSKLPRHTVTALGSQEGLKRQRDERPLISPPTKPLVSTHVMNHSLKRERDEEHLVFPPAKRVAPAIREGFFHPRIDEFEPDRRALGATARRLTPPRRCTRI